MPQSSYNEAKKKSPDSFYLGIHRLEFSRLSGVRMSNIRERQIASDAQFSCAIQLQKKYLIYFSIPMSTCYFFGFFECLHIETKENFWLDYCRVNSWIYVCLIAYLAKPKRMFEVYSNELGHMYICMHVCTNVLSILEPSLNSELLCHLDLIDKLQRSSFQAFHDDD